MSEQNTQDVQNTQQELSELLQIRRDKLKSLQESGNDPYKITTSDRDTLAKDITDNFEEMENKDVCIAGRIMSWRDMGKASFIDVFDRSGRMQVYVRINDVGEDTYKVQMSKWDIGDIVEVKGFVFKTRRGEVSVHAKEIKLLSKPS